MSKFKSGQSGNPSGRPKGALNKATLATQALLDGEAEALTRKVVELAKEGNLAALRLCLERLLPPPEGSADYLRLAAVGGGRGRPPGPESDSGGRGPGGNHPGGRANSDRHAGSLPEGTGDGGP